ncbi:MAG: plasmid pRiA4b ORF-3 family protein, partial [Bacteroidota bacterium]
MGVQDIHGQHYDTLFAAWGVEKAGKRANLLIKGVCMSTTKTIYQMKVTLIGSKPPIWRRFLVEDTVTLGKLHEILQIVMGWTNSHLHHFIIDGEFYGMPSDDDFGDMMTKDETRFKLNQFDSGKGFKFGYEYDFGDSWEHDLVIEKILTAEKGGRYPTCIAGKRACPPEDVGGIWGYVDFLKAISDPKHPEHAEMREWIGSDFDPERFNLNAVNAGLHHPLWANMDEQGHDELALSPGGQVLERIANWASGLDEKQITLIDTLALRRDTVTLLTYFKENRPVGTQSTGNLPLKAVREVCAQFVNPPVLDEKIGGKVYKLRSEEDVFGLFYLHMLANTGGLVTGGQARAWRLTSSGEAFLNAAPPLQLGYMLDVWWNYEDWRIAFPVSGLTQGLPVDFRKVILKRLLKLPVGESTTYEPFADEL